MKDVLNKAFIFTIGATIGSLVTWKFLEEKYRRIAQEEIDSVKEVFSRRENTALEQDEYFEDEDDEDIDACAEEYVDTIEACGYVNYSDVDSSESAKKEVAQYMKKPHVISPDDFGEIDEYETISLIYHADGVLTDYDNNIIEDVEGMVGLDFPNHFGEYEDDSVFVRNDKKKCDYEILLVSSNYSDSEERSYPTEDE